ncbi:MAG: ATP-dependent zinc metalloprotease FtsH [Gemmataceae bacterium]
MPKKGKDRPIHWISNSLGLLIVALLLLAFFWYDTGQPSDMMLTYGEFKQLLQAPNATFHNVVVSRGVIRGELTTRDPAAGTDTKDYVQTVTFRAPRVGLEHDGDLHALLQERVGPSFRGEDEDSLLKGIASMLFTMLFLLALVVVGFLFIRYMAGGQSPLTIGRSKHKLYAEDDNKTTFMDVAGIDEAKAELREVVDFLKTPQKYKAVGGRIPKGVLLVGPPGTGKTLLAKAVAGEAGVPFFSLSGSDFVEMFVGVGAARVRDLFGQAEKRAPCIIFIDELDALGKTRGGQAIGGHDEREQTLNQLLVEMDGFDSDRGVIIMAATNRPETLDAALLRPGRFDRTVVVDRPDINGREAILKVHVRDVKLGPDVDLRHVAALTPGSVGADLANIVNESALMAARGGKEVVGMTEFNEAIERCAVGLERRSRIMQDDEKERVAYHEAGHALVACALPNTHPVHKVSIIPRGIGALGYVLSRPEDDRYLMTRSELESAIKVALAGTVAEEIVFREISNGATNDLDKASQIARNMVRMFGMSQLGRVYFPEGGGLSFLPGVAANDGGREYSEQTAREIDLEVRKIIDAATEEVRGILAARRTTLEAVARCLIEKEVIDGVELRHIIDQHDPGPKLVPASLPPGADQPEPPRETPYPTPLPPASGQGVD